MIDKFTPIKQRYQLLAFVVSWVICYHVLTVVLNQNFENGVYPSESDSLSIPIFTNVFLGLLIFFICSVGILTPKSKILGIFSVLSFVLATLLTLSGIPEWLGPNHYLIAVGHVFPLMVCFYMLLSSLKLRAMKLKQKNEKLELTKPNLQ